MTTENAKDSIANKLNAETAKIPWRELQRFFAAGDTVYVDKSIDLIDVATAISEDNAEKMTLWMQQQQVQPVTDEQALQWFESNTLVWAVVISPWVLIQTT